MSYLFDTRVLFCSPCDIFLTNRNKSSVIWTADVAVKLKRLEAKTAINTIDVGCPTAISITAVKLPLSHTQTETRNFSP
jgi:hypothetical protein